MAQGENKEINQLEQATEIQDADLFVLEQGGDAKKLLGSTLKSYAEEAGINAIREIYPRTTASNDPDNSVFDVEIPDAGEVSLPSTVIKGKTAAVNQLVSSLNTAAEVYGITRTAIGTTGIRVYGTSSNTTDFTLASFPAMNPSHTYYASLGTASVLPAGALISFSSIDKQSAFIVNNSNNASFGIRVGSGTAIDINTYPWITDLTLRGFTSSETTDVATLKAAWLNKYGTPLPLYAPQDAGSLVNVNGEYRLRGRNLWDEEWENGAINSDGSTYSDNTRIRSKNYIPVIGGSTCYFCQPSGIGSGRCAFYDANKNFISYNSTFVGRTTFTVPENACYMKFCPGANYGTTYNYDICINISDASFNGTYEKYYNGGSIDCSGKPLNGTAASQDEEDFATGKRTTRYGMVDLGTLTWGLLNTTTDVFYAELSDGTVLSSTVGSANGVCGIYVAVSKALGQLGDKEFTLGSRNVYANRGSIMVRDSAYTDAATFKTAMNGVYLCYELATPVTTTETPQPVNTQYGYNVFEPVSGGVQSAEVDTVYYENIAGYIDKRLNGG